MKNVLFEDLSKVKRYCNSMGMLASMWHTRRIRKIHTLSFLGKRERKRPLGRPWSIPDYIYLKETGLEDADCIDLEQGRDQ
jgi:hypothetical protein